ncbi:HIT family protein [Streptobacillus felis]|uniref:HIT family protein n=1 Tax=Streptobacillus felis TaxID=1384509 RepID=A0A7Z0PHF6_9FUSO|nr:HIT family protein [Streptobacillus felis]NYV28305.1 HIT family protein [Streptobacillus felis]
MKIYYKDKEITMLDEKTQKELENMIKKNYDNLYNSNCIFCNEINEKDVFYETENFLCVWNKFPIQDGHILVISKKHYMNILDLEDEILFEMIKLQKKLIQILEEDKEVLGVTTSYNNGKIMHLETHFHFHLVPRYFNDGFWDEIKVNNVKFNKELFLERLSKN